MAGDDDGGDWAASQAYELAFWRDQWPLRALPPEAIRRRRLDDAAWFLEAMGFPREGERRFAGFAGRVLEVGSGPVGFFDLVEGIACDATDSLMAAYARELPYAALGRSGSTTYLDLPRGLEDVAGGYDFVVCSNVLDHTGDWRAFLAALCGIAARAPGGRLLLYTHARGAPLPGHTQVFTPGAVLDAAQAAGLRTVERAVARPCPPHAEYELFLRAGS